MASAIAINPIVFSFVSATGGEGGTVPGYNVVFIKNQDPTWIEKTIFEATFTPTATATGLSFGSAFELLKAGTPIERLSRKGLSKLTDFKTADVNSISNGGSTPETIFKSIKEVNVQHPSVSHLARLTQRDQEATDWQAVVSE